MNEPVSKEHRTGVVAIVGRPSTGKSTFLNRACGHTVSIISAIPQTTRNRIRGIVNRPGGQLVFVDTPGFHESDRTFNRHMRGLIEESIRDAELILYVVDPTRPLGSEEESLCEIVTHHSSLPALAVVNKIDLVDESSLVQTVAWLRQRLPAVPVRNMSAETGDGVEPILDELIRLAPEGEAVYPEDHYTDQLPEFRVAEIIREQAINRTSREVPHSIYVEVSDMEIRPSGGAEDTLWIRAFLLVERESQKGILVGKAGAKIKTIRQSAQKEIASLFPYRIHLDLRVKVDPKWRRRDHVLERLVN